MRDTDGRNARSVDDPHPRRPVTLAGVAVGSVGAMHAVRLCRAAPSAFTPVDDGIGFEPGGLDADAVARLGELGLCGPETGRRVTPAGVTAGSVDAAVATMLGLTVRSAVLCVRDDLGRHLVARRRDDPSDPGRLDAACGVHVDGGDDVELLRSALRAGLDDERFHGLEWKGATRIVRRRTVIGPDLVATGFEREAIAVHVTTVPHGAVPRVRAGRGDGASRTEGLTWAEPDQIMPTLADPGGPWRRGARSAMLCAVSLDARVRSTITPALAREIVESLRAGADGPSGTA